MAWENGNSRTSTGAWKKIRQQAKHQLPYQCAHCGGGERLELDHIINHARSSTEALSNLRWLCPPWRGGKTRNDSYRDKCRRSATPRRGKGNPSQKMVDEIYKAPAIVPTIRVHGAPRTSSITSLTRPP